MYRLKDKVVVLTGASSGIGASIAEHLFKEGAKVCMGARRLDKLSEVQAAAKSKYGGGSGSDDNEPNPGVLIFQKCDVTDRHSVVELVAEATSQLGEVDVMINCAGVMYFTEMKNALVDQWETTVDVNCKGVMNGIGAVVKQMVTRGTGKIITISSDAGMRDFQNLAVYCASKKFVETLTEITRRELVGTGVTLTTICPGDVKGTELVMNNTDKEAADKVGVEIGKPCGTGFDRNQLLDPSDIADAVIYALTAPPHVAVNTLLIEPRDQE
jgi:NADP-dependent 3-hydroxy acid dehydrogenase YdfG